MEAYIVAFRVQLDRFSTCALSLGGPFRILSTIYKMISHLFKYGLDCYNRESKGGSRNFWKGGLYTIVVTFNANGVEGELRPRTLREKPNIRARIRSNTDRRTPRMPQCSDVFDCGWLEIHLEYSIGIRPVFPYSNLILVNDSKCSINHTGHDLVD